MPAKPRTLFDISQDYDAVASLLEALEGEITEPEIEATFDKWFSELGAERDKKIDAYGMLIKQFTYSAEDRKAEAQRLSKLGQVDENQAKRLKTRLFDFFKVHGLAKLKTLHFNFGINKAGGIKALTTTIAPEQLPDEQRARFTRTEIHFNNEAIRTALDAGEELDFAHYEERGEYLSIR
jgi:Siphovirus Gp157